VPKRNRRDKRAHPEREGHGYGIGFDGGAVLDTTDPIGSITQIAA